MRQKSNSTCFFVHTKNIEKSSYTWNMIGTTLMAFQSVILLMVLTRTIGLKNAGIFTIAYANANLLLTIGKYGTHNYQVSDTKPIFNFGNYRCARIITTVAMLLAAAVYTIIAALKNAYDTEKSMVILWMCIFKAVDAVEDVYCAFYQQQGRLDVSGKLMTMRLILTILCFITCILISQNLLLSLITSTVFTILLFLLFNQKCRAIFVTHINEKPQANQIKKLLLHCSPLFAIGFLSYYISNAPKYAIDNLLTDELQACYGFIAMPIFVIGLVGNYLFNPIIKSLSENWNQRNFSRFRNRLCLQALAVIGITAVCIGGAYLLGIPVLSFIYGTDLSAYKKELLILLAGGGFLALSNQLMTAITIIRQQKWLIGGYGICALLALIMSPMLVSRYSIMGAAMLELMLMALLAIIFAIILAIATHRASNKSLSPQTKESEQ